MGLAGQVRREVRDHGAGGGRRSLHHPGAQQCVRAGRRHGPHLLDLTYTPAPEARPCCGRVNRGLAILGDTLYMGTLDAHLLAIDAKNGKILWNTTVGVAADRYAITHAPLIVKDKVIVGMAGGDGPIRGYIAAFDAKTGKEAWRFYTIPGPGEPGHETWSGDSWKTGGAAIWNIGAYDPDTNLTYWGIGNPGAGYQWRRSPRRQPL